MRKGRGGGRAGPRAGRGAGLPRTHALSGSGTRPPQQRDCSLERAISPSSEQSLPRASNLSLERAISPSSEHGVGASFSFSCGEPNGPYGRRRQGAGAPGRSAGRGHGRPPPRGPPAGTRRVRLVREEGRDVSSQYGRRDETCPVSTGGRGGGGLLEVQRADVHALGLPPPARPVRSRGRPKRSRGLVFVRCGARENRRSRLPPRTPAQGGPQQETRPGRGGGSRLGVGDLAGVAHRRAELLRLGFPVAAA